MWADTITVDTGTWLVGIRADSARTADRLRDHLATRVVSVPDATGGPEDNYSLVAPHIVLGHGTLYRNRVAIAESRRMSVLLAALDTDLAGLDAPPGMVRLNADLLIRGARAVLVAGRSAQHAPPRGSRLLRDAALWVDAQSGQVQLPGDPQPYPLVGVVTEGTPVNRNALMGIVAPATEQAVWAWLGLLAEMAAADTLRASGDRHAVDVATELAGAGSR